jgi:hypothetical protein
MIWKYQQLLLNNFGKKEGAISYDDFKMVTLSIFGNNWINDVEDIAYFYKTMNFVELDKYKNGSINALIFIENFKMPKLTYFWIKVLYCRVNQTCKYLNSIGGGLDSIQQQVRLWKGLDTWLSSE